MRMGSINSRFGRRLAPSFAAVGWVFCGCLGLLTSFGMEAASAQPQAPISFWVEADEPPGTVQIALGGFALQSLAPSSEVETVLLIDQWLLDSAQLAAAAEALAAQARRLVNNGPVEVVLLGEDVRTTLEATSDADTLAQALSWIPLREGSEEGPWTLRRRFLAQAEATSGGEEPGALELARVGTALRRTLRAESRALAQRQEGLLTWLAERERPERGVVILLSSGMDEDPAAFYRQWLVQNGMDSLEPELHALGSQATFQEVGQAFSAYQWVVLPVLPPATLASRTTAQASEETRTDPALRSVDPLMGDPAPGVDLGRLADRMRGLGKEPVLFANAVEGLERLAKLTGGRLARNSEELTEEIKNLERRHLLSATVPDLGGDLAQVAWGSNRTLARRWLSLETPKVISELRARSMLESALADEEVTVTAAFRPKGVSESGAELAVQVTGLDADWPVGSVRVSIAIETDEETIAGQPVPKALVTHHRFDAVPESALEDQTAEEPALYLFDVPIPNGVDSRLAVAVEDLGTGAWGGAFAALLEPESNGSPDTRLGADASSSASADTSSWLLPAPKLVNILLPQQPLLMGTVAFDSVVSSREVKTIQYWVDGDLQATVGPPFRAALDLGRLPTPKRIEVVALGAAGQELERDLRVINQGGSDFSVRVVSPSAEELAQKRIVGPLTLEVEARAPRDQRIERLEFFWGTERVATLFRPPFRQTLDVPSAESTGYIRVVAFLEDGLSTEDVILVNSPGSSERVDVDLVELYVVVTNRKGEPVTGIAQERFKVLEQGQQQEIQTFGEAVALPMTVGLAVDSSASMFVKLDSVQQAASGFVRGLDAPRDRAFVVGFGDEPVLYQGATTDPERAVDGLERLRPSGSTGLWRATVFSLVQLQGVRGKKALIVYSDGADEDKDFSFRTCYRFAQRVGVPVYVIVSNDEIERTGGKGLSVKPFLDRLDRLTKVSGGRVFLASVDQDLAEVYETISNELKSQYLLGYYAQRGEDNDWREIEVDVEGLGLKARTISGYFR